LDPVTPEAIRNPKSVWGLYEVQISCVVTGWDEFRWIAYGFVDSEIDGYLADYTEDDLIFDPIGGGNFDKDFPHWRPRDYWIKVFEHRIAQVMLRWENLVKEVELSIIERKNELMLATPEKLTLSDLAEGSKWNSKMRGLLSWLEGSLSATNEAWDSFFNDDISYFNDTDAWVRRSILEIKDKFRCLRGYQRKMSQLTIRLEGYHKRITQLQEDRNLEERKKFDDQNKFISEFTVSVLYPLALTTAIFSMQPQVIPFDLTHRSLIITVLALFAVVFFLRHVIKAMWYRWAMVQKAFSNLTPAISVSDIMSLLTWRARVKDEENRVT